ncbi:MAG: hypothetical protein HQL98_09980 [Magnetococcales bacterium]|nr:hypothetical protein [Magnetococcales bacterium]
MSCEKVAQILARLDRTTADRLLSHLEKHESALARAVRDHLVVFEDLEKLDDRGLQTLLREIAPEELATALRGMRESLVKRFANQLSRHGAEVLREALTFSSPPSRHQVETARKGIITLARALEADGRLVLPSRADPLLY